MANSTVTKILFRRGTDADRAGVVFATGEPVWTTDTNELYIGDGSTAGGLRVATAGGGPGSSGDTSNSSQWIDESYHTVNTGYHDELPILTRAVKYNNGVVSEIQNGPGLLLRTRSNTAGAYFVLTNNSKFVNKQTGTDPTWFVSLSSASVTVGKDASWVYVSNIVPHDTTIRPHNEWVYMTASAWSNPQETYNDGIWMWFDSIQQWGFTSMSLYPYIYMHTNGGAPGTGDIINRGQDDWTYVGVDGSLNLWYYNFDDGLWYNPSTPGGSAGAPTTPATDPGPVDSTTPDTDTDQGSSGPTAPGGTP